MLGITSVDPERNELLFERFISEERGEPPDIDVDFEHQRREEVLQWIFDTYGRQHAALTAVVTRFRTRGAIRAVLKVMGFPEDAIKLISRQLSHWHRSCMTLEEAAELGLNLNDRRLRLSIDLHLQLLNVPSHLSQHPVSFIRDDLTVRGITSCAEAKALPDGRSVSVAGLVLVRQKPGSAHGVMFITLEDETSDCNVIVWEKVAEAHKSAIHGSSFIQVNGHIQKEGEVVHLIARSLYDMSPMLARVGQSDVPLSLPKQPGDEFHNGGAVLQRSRDFK